MTGGWLIRNCYKEGINLATLTAAHLIPRTLPTGKSMVSRIPNGRGGDDEWECEEG